MRGKYSIPLSSSSATSSSRKQQQRCCLLPVSPAERSQLWSSWPSSSRMSAEHHLCLLLISRLMLSQVVPSSSPALVSQHQARSDNLRRFYATAASTTSARFRFSQNERQISPVGLTGPHDRLNWHVQCMYAGVCECVFIPLVACMCLAAAGGQSYLASRCGTSSALKKKKRDCFLPTVIFMRADGIQRNSAGSCCVSAADEVWWMAVQSSVESRREKFLILYCSIVHFLLPLVFCFYHLSSSGASQNRLLKLP